MSKRTRRRGTSLPHLRLLGLALAVTLFASIGLMRGSDGDPPGRASNRNTARVSSVRSDREGVVSGTTSSEHPEQYQAARPEGPVPAERPSNGIIESPIEFAVTNKNDSPLPCASDGRRYVVHGHIVGPRSDLIAKHPEGRVVTLLLYGWDAGEWNWRFRSVPGYDYPLEMAKLGHTSVSIDMVGYDTSGHPAGSQVCWGSQADITHQIVQQLRSGSYEASGLNDRVAFDTVVLSAHDVAPVAAVMAAYTWGDIDGLTTQVFAHQGFEPYVLAIFARRVAECVGGGEGPNDPKDEPERGGEYVFFGPPDEEFAEALFLERGKGGPGGADPSVISAFLGLRNRNPCGMVTSNAQAIAMNRNNANKIEVPVLLVFPGEDDPIVSRDGEESEADNYGGSDVTSAWLDSGHFMMLEDCAPAFRRLTAHWINEHWGSGEKTSMPTVGSHECVTEVRHKGPERN